jgi:glycosyltransferase involved in cell wall biosynthesis
MKVSIVTTAYNSEKTIKRTIESVLNQTYPDIEYWIIDGSSSDGTIDIIRSFEPRFNGRLHWISEKDEGIYDAMNKGVSRSTGDVVGILNSDDFFTSNDVISRMTEHFTDDLDAVYGDVHFVKSNNLKKSVRYYSGKQFRPWMIRFGFIPPHPSLYIRRSIYEKYGLYDTSYRISADVDLIARLSYVHKISMKYIPMDFVTMLVGGESTKNLRNRWIGTKEDLKACRKLGIKSNIVFVHLKYLLKSHGYLFSK